MTPPTPEAAVQGTTESYRESTFVFRDAVGRGGSLRYCSHATEGRWRDVDISIDDSSFLFRALGQLPPLVADVVDLTAAIFVADRLSPQRLDAGMRRIRVTVPVREPRSLATSTDQLRKLLGWASATAWEFEFAPRNAPMRPAEELLTLPDLTPEGADVVLWSGGLDALAGVYDRLQSSPALPVVLLGSGSNDRVFGRQKRLAEALEDSFPGRVYLHQVPIRLRGIRGLPQDRLMRVRGVIFTLIGCMSAYVLGNRRLDLHENGVGALNLPLHDSSVGLDHVRSVHPLTLQVVSAYVGAIFGEPFRVENPSLLKTKAQMCAALAQDRRADLVVRTESCDSYHRDGVGQCGYCSSCLLRRQTLLASGLDDLTRYVVTTGKSPRRDPSVALRAMLSQVERFRTSLLPVGGHSPDAWERLTASYPGLDDVVDRSASRHGNPRQMRNGIMSMYRTYVREWDMVGNRLFEGILDRSDTTLPRISRDRSPQ